MDTLLCKTTTSLAFKSDRKQYDFTCNIKGDYVNTEIDTLQNKPFDKYEILSGKSIAFKSEEPEFLFWKDRNIILPDYDEKKVIERILATNNAANIRKIIEEQISKLQQTLVTIACLHGSLINTTWLFC